ncbi:MAG: UDP-N-acetylmuramoyl-L-alanine--D-glutamate ligase, partial [Chitinophagaceae bacterium]
IRVESEIEFGFRYKGDSKIIAITGSNGKSTTTKLCYHLLKDGGYDVSMVGNIGTSFAKQIFEKPTAWYVMELSSFQLDDTHLFRPFIAVLLNITPDHLDRYNYDFNNYIASKFLIARNQTKNDHFIVNTDDPVITDYLNKHSFTVPTTQITMHDKIDTPYGAFLKEDNIHFRYLGEDNQVSIHDLTIPGKHNQYNSMAAGISAQIAGIRKEKIRASFLTFEGLDHRLEPVGSVRGVQFVNDSKATNVNSVWYALESMKTPTVLILGGQDKGNDYSEISALVREKVKAIICLGLNNEAIHAAFSGDIKIIEDVLTADEAVHRAFGIAEPGDTVLLSPACASFDIFENYADRGNRFKAAVKAL